MIEYWETYIHGDMLECEITFSESDRQRIIKVIERGLNTLSPPDHDLIKLLEDMKK